MYRERDMFRKLPKDLAEQLPHTPLYIPSIHGHDRRKPLAHSGVTSATDIARPCIIAGKHKGLVVKRSDETPAQGSHHIRNGLSHIGLYPQGIFCQTFVDGIGIEIPG